MLGRRSQDDFHAEIRSHLQLEIDRLRAQGMSPEEAERTARRDEIRISFDWTWAWLLAVGLVLVAFALWRSVEDPERVARDVKEGALPT